MKRGHPFGKQCRIRRFGHRRIVCFLRTPRARRKVLSQNESGKNPPKRKKKKKKAKETKKGPGRQCMDPADGREIIESLSQRRGQPNVFIFGPRVTEETKRHARDASARACSLQLDQKKVLYPEASWPIQKKSKRGGKNQKQSQRETLRGGLLVVAEKKKEKGTRWPRDQGAAQTVCWRWRRAYRMQKQKSFPLRFLSVIVGVVGLSVSFTSRVRCVFGR